MSNTFNLITIPENHEITFKKLNHCDWSMVMIILVFIILILGVILLICSELNII